MHRRTAFTTALGAVFIVAFAFRGPALAQDDRSTDAEARGLFEAGAAAYDGGRFQEALDYFQRSYERSGRAALLYNIATAAERARQDELALSSYEEFLERVPDTPLRTRIETRIADLRRQIERAQTEPSTSGDASADGEASVGGEASAEDEPSEGQGSEPPIGPPPQTGAGSGGGPGVAPWIVAGGGAAVAVTGAILLGLGLSDRAAVEDPEEGARWLDGADGAYERGPTLLTVGGVLLPAGLLLGAAGVVWALVPPSGEEQLSVRVGPGTLELAGGF